ncbi:hypothetical protein [Planomonospora venezuelensis]|uniref:Sterol desaturase/sphingolipid hydroxylase (Fatty acid hydroxylase superfamily) n=1 Tax=Planomonospora venezuelensis TaxID=1999 RepID=A0A841D0J3_PLAVE|nr:hypothetical protein [Planomonospora venezuelensis]MBB5963029.1 sterol desaturase/sphingolipid hydroxylase (fatty acid hydroxylase superfamily) [Planomonospora venezuelensis]GIN00597.1 hypothetical protein Pve01_22550 [Planomonospora venezuelensis]
MHSSFTVDPAAAPALWVVIAVLLGVIAALVAGILSQWAGGTRPTVLTWGAGAFTGTVTLALAIITLLHALSSAGAQASQGGTAVLGYPQPGLRPSAGALQP